MVVVGGDVRRHVHPVLEQVTPLGGVVDVGARVRAEAGEQRQLLAAHEHVDRVDLDHADAVEHTAEVATIDATGRARIGETLRRDGDAPGFRSATACSATASRRHTVGHRFIVEYMPPSAEITSPVIALEASEARNTTTSAISSTV